MLDSGSLLAFIAMYVGAIGLRVLLRLAIRPPTSPASGPSATSGTLTALLPEGSAPDS